MPADKNSSRKIFCQFLLLLGLFYYGIFFHSKKLAPRCNHPSYRPTQLPDHVALIMRPNKNNHHIWSRKALVILLCGPTIHITTTYHLKYSGVQECPHLQRVVNITTLFRNKRFMLDGMT